MVAAPQPESSHFSLRSVVWTRGEGCGELADAISPGAVRVEGDLEEICRAARAELLVTRRLTNFNLVSVAVPHELDLEAVTSVTAAVAGGPHSELAAVVARQLSESLDVSAELVSSYGADDRRSEVRESLAMIAALVEDIPYRLIEADQPADLTAELDAGSLLVVGAPGGSWLQRQFFGTGRRLQNRAPSGTVVVRSAPQRAFQLLRQPEAYVSPMLGTADALALIEFPVLPVADNGKLVGIVRRSALMLAGAGTQVGEVMEDPVAVMVDSPIDEIGQVGEALGGAPVPVIDDDGFLVGVVGP
ncbi:MAG: hypothetical protein P1T08_00590 [Acidimicrobiia bacterium]|nr:hypothetical protein [Acidimicrobiia bacterium]